MKLNSIITIAALGATLWTEESCPAQNVTPGAVDARMFRYPAVSATQIAFVYAGDIWIVPKSGGTATRLTSPRGEEMFPRFSPDGTEIAFSGDYDGNVDIYVVNAQGGLPRRVTHHGASDRMLNWYPDGKSLLYASMMTSEKDRFNQLYKVSSQGGLPEKLPVPYGEFGAISPDGTLLAYLPISVDFRTWKRYRGGMAPDIWLFNLEDHSAKNITNDDANDAQPMWHESTLYFLTDRDENKRANIWSYDTKTGNFRQITNFKEMDVHWPSIGPSEMVFESGGRLYVLDLATEKYQEVTIKVVTDRATLKPQARNVSAYIHGADISPNGKRAVFEARGDLFTVPVENGFVRTLTRTSGIFERDPTWSPDGKQIAYFSDRSGEYELTVRSADGTGDETTLTKLGPGFRYRLSYSPDSKKIAFIDQAMKVHIYDFDKKETKQIDKMMWLYQGGLQRFKFNWSPDSRWLAYAGDQENRNSAIVIYDTREGQRHQVTAGFYDDDEPAFDPTGKFLYFRSGRTFSPVYSDLEPTWVYPNSRNLFVVTLKKEAPSPLFERNDEEGDKDKDKDKETKKSDDDKKSEGKKEDGDEAKKEGDDKEVKKEEKKEEKKDEKPKPVEIDFADFERRAVLLPQAAGRYEDLSATRGKFIYRRLPRTGSSGEKSPIFFWDLEKREEKQIVDDADSYALAAKGEKMLVVKGANYSIIEIKEGQNLNKKLATGGLEATVDPVAEWQQIFNDAWRLERDMFYDPKMHGVDWQAMRLRYGSLLKDAVTRWDVEFVIGELISELNASHTYRSGGDKETAPSRGVGYLGCDFSLENGAYRIKKIIDGAAWDSEARSPLLRPGVNVKEGDYLLAINGADLDITQDPWAALQGLADKPTMLTVNDKPSKEGSRTTVVRTLSSEARLRNLGWIETKRKHVDEASGGRIGYIYVPDTGTGGQNELVRQYHGQYQKDGLVIDERFNSGGQIPDRFIELLSRKPINYWGVRDGKDWSWPQSAHSGPMAMLINGWSGSGGDCFPYYFKAAGLGPLIGTRTWGGLIGITGAPGLMDNGSVTVPTFGIYSTKGEWIIEGHGVDPDIKVVDDPSLMANGDDPQLDRAIEEVMKELKANPPPTVKKPMYPNRSGK